MIFQHEDWRGSRGLDWDGMKPSIHTNLFISHTLWGFEQEVHLRCFSVLVFFFILPNHEEDFDTWIAVVTDFNPWSLHITPDRIILVASQQPHRPSAVT